MKNYILLFVLFFVLDSLRSQSRSCSQTCNSNAAHSFLECVASSGSGDLINGLSVMVDLGREFFGSNIKVSRQDESRAGEELLTDARKKYKFVNTGDKYLTLQTILQKLVARIQKPQGYSFKIYLIESEVVNAWTCGGMIFVTTAIYDFCKSVDEIACIVGHEISHNLLGHINTRLRDLKIAGQFGLPGMISASIGMFATQSIGQQDESHSDLLGVDLAYAAGYKVCDGVSLWNRMAEKSGEFSEIANFISSHPHPEKRAICLQDHLKSKFNLKCEN